MARLLISGGKQREPRSVRTRPEWKAYEEAILAELDTATGETRVLLRWQTPPDRRPDGEASYIFKTGSWDGEKLLLCTQTEVLVVTSDGSRVLEEISHPWFNDVHHVARIDGRLHVVSTGLDAVVILPEDGGEPEIRSATEADPWLRFDPETDYRKILTTKPHECHPNFVFSSDTGLWLTRFEQLDAICLDDRERKIRVEIGRPHDGCRHDGRAWFTAVNGHVVVADLTSGDIVARYDLNEIENSDVPLGWCRGLLLEDGIAYVGFSRLRMTRWRKNLSWVKRALEASASAAGLPSRVVAYDLERGQKLDEWETDSCDINGLFTILPSISPASSQ